MEKINFELSEICGIHAGDGYLRRRNSGKSLGFVLLIQSFYKGKIF